MIQIGEWLPQVDSWVDVHGSAMITETL